MGGKHREFLTCALCLQRAGKGARIIENRSESPRFQGDSDNKTGAQGPCIYSAFAAA
ncbi:hypothetical protein B565_3339 [Aeromonas veronii B565]|nr:hypothetical protein B565_3339 [Aeromonas veronii B565]